MELPSVCYLCELNLAEYLEGSWCDDAFYYSNSYIPAIREEIVEGQLFIFSDSKRTFCHRCFFPIWKTYKQLKPTSSGCGLCNRSQPLVVNQYRVTEFFRCTDRAKTYRTCKNESYYGFDFHSNSINVELIHLDINQRFIRMCKVCVDQLKISTTLNDPTDTFC